MRSSDPPITRARSRGRWIAATLLAAVALAACGSDAELDAGGGGSSGGSEQGGASANVSDQDAAVLEFYQCLRDNGLDVSDPDRRGGISLGDADPDDPAVQDAVESCRGNLSESGRITFGNMGENRADTAALIAFVDCMRGHGIDMADPGPDGQLSLPEELDPNTNDFQSATQDCVPHLGGGGIIMGSPDGEGGPGVATRGGP